ncbi:MAG: FAD-dependent oxidoreductase [Gammaproteobacteria bacterium]|nr:FAD-dependent oxidoreductase [Gammaproteobacteria bacterium]
MSRIAIIGAGLSGLVVARALQSRHDVTVFEKARGVGGRMATRSAGAWEFDHGAQFFTARTPEFQDFLRPLREQELVAEWRASCVELNGRKIKAVRNWSQDFPRLVATPKMNALGKWLADGLTVRANVNVQELERDGAGWHLIDATLASLGPFDWVVSSAPAPQTAALLPDYSPLHDHARGIAMQACFALLLGFDAAPDPDWQAALVHDADIGWISVNSSKPGRSSACSIVVHSTNAWAEQHIDDPVDDVTAHLVRTVSEISGIEANSAAHCDLHRWRYANINTQRRAAQVDPDNRLAACGDWFVRGRVEGAFTSAQRLLSQLAPLIDA